MTTEDIELGYVIHCAERDRWDWGSFVLVLLMFFCLLGIVFFSDCFSFCSHKTCHRLKANVTCHKANFLSRSVKYDWNAFWYKTQLFIVNKTPFDFCLFGRLKSKPLPKVPARDYRGKGHTRINITRQQ